MKTMNIGTDTDNRHQAYSHTDLLGKNVNIICYSHLVAQLITKEPTTMMETMLPLILIVILLAHLINKEFVKEGCLSRMLLKLFKVFHGKMSFHPFSGDSKNAKLVGPMIIDILPKNCFAISIHLFWILDAVCS